mgnify:CR=1 FL=1
MSVELSRLDRERLRYYVRRRDRADKSHRCLLGLDTFETDWARLQEKSSYMHAAVENRTIWLLWHQGEDQAPPLIQACLHSWRQKNPTWQVRVLDQASLDALIDTGQYPRKRALHHISDLVRLDLLKAYGGVWADATTLCMQPLDQWIDDTMAADFFAFARPQPLRSIASWFLAANPKSELLAHFQNAAHAYLNSRRPPQSYFFFHHTFDWLLETYPSLQKRWAQSPRISARGPHVLQRLLDDTLPLDTRPSATQLAEVPLFKLNRKKGYTVEQIDHLLESYGLSRTAP